MAEIKLLGDPLHSNENYMVVVVRMPDMDFDTYGIINKETLVLEQIQPNLYNAKFIADQFNKWLLEGPSGDEETDVSAFLELFGGNRGKAN